MSTPGDLLEALGREARARWGGAADEDERVHSFRGRSLEELIPRIERELGADAVIVRRREGLRGGVLGFFQHPFVEIEATRGAPRLDTYDHPEAAQPQAPRVSLPAPSRHEPAPPRYEQPPPRHGPPSPHHGPPAPDAEQPSAFAGPAGAYVTAHLASLARERAAVSPLPSSSPPPSIAPPGFDLQELLPREHAPARRSAPAREPDPWARSQHAPPREPAPTPERRTVPTGTGAPSYGRARAGVERSLRRFGVGEELAAELLDGALAHTVPLTPRTGLAQAVRATLVQRIPVASPLPAKGAAVVIVGSGGSGKTTCCATMLGAYRRASALPAAYASVVRPAEDRELQLLLSPQLRKPALASSARALRALRQAREQSLAILDTPSLSPADRSQIRELARLLGQIKPDRVVVALPATLGPVAAVQLLQALAPLGAGALAITHAEETDQLGVAVEAACRFGLAPELMLERARAGGWRLRRVEPAELAGRLLP